MEFDSLELLAIHLRERLEKKKYILLFAYNGTGKTRLSMAFKEQGKQDEGTRDTLYFNAFTEDLFSWDNDLDADYLSSLDTLITAETEKLDALKTHKKGLMQ